MRKRFTDSFLKALKPTGERQTFKDSTGLYLRVGAAGGRSYYARYRWGKRERWMKLGNYPDMPLTDARAKLSKVMQSVKQAREGDAPDPAAAKAVERAERLAAPTVEQFVQEYIDRYAKVHKKSWKEDERQLDLDVVPVIGGLKVRDVAKRHILAIMDRIEKRGHPKQAGECLKVVRRMFSFSIDRDLISTNPCAGIKAPAKYEPKDRVLSDKELSGLLSALDAATFSPTIKDCLTFQALTAVRPSEAREARWDEIDEKRRLWTIPRTRTKMGRPHAVPLTDAAIAVLERAREYSDGSGYVFPGQIEGKPLSELAGARALARSRELLKKHGCGFFSPHDLRRTAATKIAELGYGLAVPHVLGHHQRTVTRIHYDLYDYTGEKRAALEAWAGHFEAIRRGSAGVVVALGAPLRAA